MKQLVSLRDVNGEMRKVIEEELDRHADAPWVAASVAVDLVERLRQDDPELLNKWLEHQAVRVVRGAIVGLEGARRQQARIKAERRRPPSVFAKALEQYEETGRRETLAAWLDTTFIVTAKNQRKTLGDMDQEDLRFAADNYTRSARALGMQAAFLRVLANRVGAKKVSEVFDEEELSRIWRELDRMSD
jgi:hypothetical protein